MIASVKDSPPDVVSNSVPEYIQERRAVVFLVLAGLFLGTLGMLNILGISRFVNIFTWHDFAVTVAVGVLPYPLTFLCTDLISELYGRTRANQVVWVGLLLNLWVVFIVWLGGILPGFEAINPTTGELVRDAAGRVPVFFEIRNLTFGAVTASMIAYLTAQFVDVQLFHFWKELTQGKYLWLRNNGSTLLSQLVDTSAVVLITHFLAGVLPIDPARGLWPQLLLFIGYGYAFKLVAALLDTGPFYVSVYWLSKYLQLEAPAFEPSSSVSTPTERQ
ncbi:queuosine precursor transporter [Leptothoe spongobia]|uniref:Probable queuosine precursor transporter n=1 Tax=Leptothoe spongobia TAU-MAC 1115 TaxID=1967444 RepID=A0A947DIY1_9CYAN|nr:queuosine precursor transporter [Leptothoe spongobia]MBT9317926.1 queuosine precursor transporter [Leptothoe spongobia TAU-MAC 1115]